MEKENSFNKAQEGFNFLTQELSEIYATYPTKILSQKDGVDFLVSYFINSEDKVGQKNFFELKKEYMDSIKENGEIVSNYVNHLKNYHQTFILSFHTDDEYNFLLTLAEKHKLDKVIEESKMVKKFKM